MTSPELSADMRNTRDNINPSDTEGASLILIRKKESAFVEEGSFITETRDVSADTIWGAFNWGAANWDGTYTYSSIKQRVLNPNNIFRDYLRDAEFVDTSTTTTTVSTANYNITFASTGDIYQTQSIFLNNQTVTRANLYIDAANITNSDRLLYYLSADGGSTWELATLGSEHTFTVTGTDLKYKIVCSGTALISINDVYGISKPMQCKYVTRG